MPRYTLDIPGWRPALLNELLGHPLKAHRLKKRDAEQLWKARLAYGVPVAETPRRVSFTITDRFRGGLPDPDAPLKSLLDGLKRSGLIRDDSAAWCRWDAPVFNRGSKGTVIVLEDP